MKFVGETKAKELRWNCPLHLLKENESEFETIKYPCQKRVADGLQFLLNGSNSQFHMYAIGSQSTPRREILNHLLNQTSTDTYNNRNDWVYVYQCSNPRSPKAIQLEPGQGRKLQFMMNELVVSLAKEIPETLRDAAYGAKLHKLERDYQRDKNTAIIALRERAMEKGLTIKKKDNGFAICPENETAELSAAELHEFEQIEQPLRTELESILQQEPAKKLAFEDEKQLLERETVAEIVTRKFAGLKNAFSATPEVIEHLNDVENFLHNNYQTFMSPAAKYNAINSSYFIECRVNLFVDAKAKNNKSVSFWRDISTHDLLGQLEFKSCNSGLTTSFMMLRPGILHRANGGVALFRAEDLLRNPPLWQALKKALLEEQIQIQANSKNPSLVPIESLDPEPIPLSLKVIIIGDDTAYAKLKSTADEFTRIFPLIGEIAATADRTEQNIRDFGRFVNQLAKETGIPAMQPEAIGRIIEDSCRRSPDKDQLSLETVRLKSIFDEIAYQNLDPETAINREAVDQALTRIRSRQDGPYRDLLRQIENGRIMISTWGERIGQVNCLSMLTNDRCSFGKALRVTAQVSPGKNGAGMVLNGYIAGQLALDKPLSFNASLVFEQSNESIDEDSPSLGEVIALLSALSKLPVAQSLAVVGGINQHGDVEPVGGIEEKVRAFYDICIRDGLSGNQGVIIPTANLGHIMLDPEVVQACEEQKFHIYAVSRVEEAAELMMTCERTTLFEKVNSRCCAD